MHKSILILISMFAFLIVLAISAYAHTHPERWYQSKWCVDGEMEVVMVDRTRVDCLLSDYAVEVDFASKWAECAGQAMHYSRLTRRPPGCVLIIEKDSDLKHLKKFKDSFYWIKVWLARP